MRDRMHSVVQYVLGRFVFTVLLEEDGAGKLRVLTHLRRDLYLFVCTI